VELDPVDPDPAATGAFATASASAGLELYHDVNHKEREAGNETHAYIMLGFLKRTSLNMVASAAVRGVLHTTSTTSSYSACVRPCLTFSLNCSTTPASKLDLSVDPATLAE